MNSSFKKLNQDVKFDYGIDQEQRYRPRGKTKRGKVKSVNHLLKQMSTNPTLAQPIKEEYYGGSGANQTGSQPMDGRTSVNSSMDSSFKHMAFMRPATLQALERFEKERTSEDFRTKNRISLMRNMGKRGTLL